MNLKNMKSVISMLKEAAYNAREKVLRTMLSDMHDVAVSISETKDNNLEKNKTYREQVRQFFAYNGVIGIHASLLNPKKYYTEDYNIFMYLWDKIVDALFATREAYKKFIDRFEKVHGRIYNKSFMKSEEWTWTMDTINRYTS